MLKPLLLLNFSLFSTLLMGQMDTTDFAKEFAPMWERSKAYTIAVAEAMPETLYDYRPTEDVMTFKEQMAHIASNFASLQRFITGSRASRIQDIKKDIENSSSKADIINTLIIGFDFVDSLLYNTSDPHASTDFFADVPMTKAKIFQLMRNHVTHHRGQLILYLRLKGIAPPRYVGW